MLKLYFYNLENINRHSHLQWKGTIIKNLQKNTVSFSLREAAIILCLALAGYLLLSLCSYQPIDPGWSTTGMDNLITNRGGIVGAWLSDILLYGFGFSAYFSPLILAFGGWLLFSWERISNIKGKLYFWILQIIGLVITLSSLSGLSTLNLNDDLLPFGAGGALGEAVGHGFESIFGSAGTTLLLLAVLLTGITLLTGISWLTIIAYPSGIALISIFHFFQLNIS
ncbi:MAG: DNA translocase FtsK 4TM domain-containing protein [Piscirickettsiaceae bacterium]|nr:DNA translocase FtsK 4TM domain-containing protein [Piscirickettsiaceae bacterium]